MNKESMVKYKDLDIPNYMEEDLTGLATLDVTLS